MNELLKLKNRKAKALDSAAAVLKIAEDEDREMTEEEKSMYDGFVSEADALQTRIDAREAIIDRIEKTPASENAEVENAVERVTDGTPAFLKAKNYGYEKGIGEFALEVQNAGNRGLQEGSKLAIIEKHAAATGMSIGVGSDGGFLLPPLFSDRIYEGVFSSESLLGMTDSYPVQVGQTLEMPAVNETSRAAGSRHGGVRGYWLAEAAQMTGSKPAFRKIALKPKKLGVLCYATDELLMNVSALSRFLASASIDEINFLIGDSIVNGDGVGKPIGILSSGCVVSITKESSQAADTVVAGNINKMWARLFARSRGNAVWLINQDVDPQLDGINIPLTDVGGTATVGGFAVKVYNADNYTLKGRPIMPIEYCQTVGDAGDVILADMMGYVTGYTAGVDSAMSIHLRFDYNETAFRFIFAVDGQTWLNSAVTPYKGSNTQSHFLKIAARA
jgi:HK97 family phage major capsid protein